MGSTIKQLVTTSEIAAAYPIMKQLRTHVNENDYMMLVQEAMDKDGYHLFALYDAGQIVAVTGFKPMITLYYGRFVWVCDLVTDEVKRSNGYGEQLLQFVEKWAKKHQYTSVALSSGLQRQQAHRFYEHRHDYEKVSFVFKKNI